MPSSNLSQKAPEFASAMLADFRGLDAREQFAATLHLAIDHYTKEGVPSEDSAYFLIAAARAALDNSDRFSTNTRLAREYLQAALELL
jgi:predicted RNA polymerase sigma factor